MKLKSDAGSNINELCSSVGVPIILFTGNSSEETDGEGETVRRKHLIPQGYIEPHTPWQNKAGLEIGEEKAHYRGIMHRSQAPEALWDHGFEHTDQIRQNTARQNLGWRTPLEVLMGDTPAISNLLDFKNYDWVWYWDPSNARFPADHRELGRWLGRNHAHGPAMCFKVSKPNIYFIIRSSCTTLTNAEKSDPAVRDHITDFTNDVDNIIGKFDSSYILEEDTAGVEGLPPLDESDDEHNLPTLDVDDEEMLDRLINAEIILPQGEGISSACVSERKRAHDGSPIGRKNQNPLLDSRIYIVKFSDGEMKDVGFNILAEHLFSQVDKDGNQFRLFSSIIGHRRSGNKIDKDDQM
jgi:hypothetical protein